MGNPKRAIVVGAGLVGSLWSIFLAKRGYTVDVFERRGDIRKAQLIGGRSINLALSTRGWKALNLAGIDEVVRGVAIPMKGRMMHSTEGELTFQPYGKEDQAIYSVSRGGLNLEMVKCADAFENVRFHFNCRCTGVDLEEDRIYFQDEHGNAIEKEADLIFGTDGAFSAVRGTMQRTNRFNYSQHYLPHGYKELTIPAAADGSHQIDKHSLHIWPRGQFMLIALPNQDGTFTCTLFLPYEGEESFDQLQTDEQILSFFKEYFGDSVPLMPDLVEDFRDNPTSSLVTIRCNPWRWKDRIMLMGDASHAIVPFYGQGMNSGFEDCTLLNELVDQYEEDWPRIFEAFNDSRPKDANAIADLALRNFIEMRDLVGDPDFLLRKKMEAWLNELYPEKFIPLYSMVTFSHIPYSVALAEGKAQDHLFEEIFKIEGVRENWQTDHVKEVFLNWMEKRHSVAPSSV